MALDPPDSTALPSIEAHEKFLKNNLKFLHPNHVFMVDVKYTLAKMYGRMEGYEPDNLTDQQFRRKMTLVQEVLAVIDKIMPGRTRKRGSYVQCAIISTKYIHIYCVVECITRVSKIIVMHASFSAYEI